MEIKTPAKTIKRCVFRLIKLADIGALRARNFLTTFVVLGS
jgi:hypothetical protein